MTNAFTEQLRSRIMEAIGEFIGERYYLEFRIGLERPYAIITVGNLGEPEVATGKTQTEHCPVMISMYADNGTLARTMCDRIERKVVWGSPLVGIDFKHIRTDKTAQHVFKELSDDHDGQPVWHAAMNIDFLLQRSF